MFTSQRINVIKTGRLSSISPALSTVRKWISKSVEVIGRQEVVNLGIPHGILVDKGQRERITPSAARLAFLVYSATCCPSNLANAFHWSTWGRFNPAMPRDYREAAQRLLERKSGPRAAKARGEAWQLPTAPPWAKAGRLKRQFVMPVQLPLLVG